jgi:superfamily I DNA/RNA helicase
MNSLKIPSFIPGPPGTGKTHKWLKNKYIEFLKKYPWDRIVILSHTNTAADEIVKAVNKLPELENIPDTNLQDQICTIHSYFKAEYLNIKKYEHEDHKAFCKENLGMNIIKKNISWDKHPLYEFISHAHGKGYDLTSETELEKYWALCERSRYEGYRLQGPGGLLELKKKYDEYRDSEEHKRISFVDMIDNFRFKAAIPTDIDVLIVDEAQDCSKPQIAALQKAATNAKEFIFIGDADQTIHEYAGSDPEYFYQLANTEEAKANELTEGLRCGQTINKICRNIIAPVWKEYGRYSERTWTPTDVIGKSHYIPRLDQGCKAKDILINKILKTDETFLFTYRGNPTHKSVNTFLQDSGIDYKMVSGSAHVSREHFSCFKNWKTFMNGKVSKQQIKNYGS